MPTPTDLVTDLPADFEVFGQAVDTQMKTNADAATQKATLTTKGDIYAATGTSTPARLAVGANDTVLTADSSTATGLKWASPASGGMTLLSTTTLSGTSTTVSSINQTYNELVFIVVSPTWGTSNAVFQMLPNGSGSIAFASGVKESASFTWSSSRGMDGEPIETDMTQDRTNGDCTYYVRVSNYTSTAPKPFLFYGSHVSGDQRSFSYGGAIVTGSALSSWTVQPKAGQTFSGGTLLIYGVK